MANSPLSKSPPQPGDAPAIHPARAIGGHSMDVPEGFVWGQVAVIIAAIVETGRRLYGLTQRVDHLEATKVEQTDYIREAAECRANMVKSVTDLREEVIGMAATVDMVARAHDIKPHPRPSNGGGQGQ